MCAINSPKFMDSGCGRKPYCSAGMACATAIDSLPRAPKCPEYSPAAFAGTGAAFANTSESESTRQTGTAARDSIRPPRKNAFLQPLDDFHAGSVSRTSVEKRPGLEKNPSTQTFDPRTELPLGAPASR